MRNGRPRANLARGSPFRAMFRGVRLLIHSEERRQYAGICRRTDNRHIRESGQALGYWFADSYKDIAEFVGLSEKNISVRLTRIREKMKQYLIEREVFV